MAIAIGVKDVDGFAQLPGTHLGAADFIKWASQEGIAIIQLLDDHGSVPFEDVDAAVKSAVGKVDQLFLYFSGHGLNSSWDRDYWLLGDEADQLIDVRRSIDNASGFSLIPHIVVFADACRTISNGRATTQAVQNARALFAPGVNDSPAPERSVIDVFYATENGARAFELRGPGEPSEQIDREIIGTHGFFTEVLIQAISGQAPSRLKRNPDTGAHVLYASELEAHLREVVPIVTGRVARFSQRPDPIVQSRHPKFIAAASPPRTSILTLKVLLPNQTPASSAEVSILDMNYGLVDPPVKATSKRGEVSRELPAGMYGARVVADPHVPKERSPGPITALLAGDQLVEIPLMDRARRAGHVARTGPPPPLTETYLIDSKGQRRDAAPADGLYSTVTVDLLSGAASTSVRALETGETPEPVGDLEEDRATADRLELTANLHEAPRSTRDHFETQLGLSIQGARPEKATVRGGTAEVFKTDEYDREFYHVRGDEPGSVVVDVEGNRHLGLALYPGFIGTGIVGELGLSSLSYSASANSQYYAREDSHDLRLARARAESLASAGRFDIVASDRYPIAEYLRIYKHADPILGVLAAYAYAQAGDLDQIENMIDYFRAAGQFVPFDLMMLAHDAYALEPDVAPAFPLLTQGWQNLSRFKGVPEAIMRARENLAPTLWLTVLGDAGTELADYIRGT